MDAASVCDCVLLRLRDLLDTRLERVVVYGSSVTGDVLAGYSDVDLLIGLTAPLSLSDAIVLQHSIDGLDLAPFSYLQPTFVLGAPDAPVLVPGAFEVVYGPAPTSEWMSEAEHLRRQGEHWLTQLPAIVAGDAADWAMATRAHAPRHARLLLTRVKPSLRALKVRLGADPVDAWTTNWPSLAREIGAADAELGAGIVDLLEAARQRRDALVAETALRILSRLCADHLGEQTLGFLVLAE